MKQSLKNAWLQLIYDNQYNYFITIAFNPNEQKIGHFSIDKRYEYAKNILKQFMNRLDRKLIGSNYLRKSKAKYRLEGIACPENLASNMHFHICAKTNLNVSPQAIKNIMNDIAIDMNLQGFTFDVQDIYNIEFAAKYILKGINFNKLNSNMNNIIILSEFHAQH
jgi:hypothetical protein